MTGDREIRIKNGCTDDTCYAKGYGQSVAEHAPGDRTASNPEDDRVHQE